MKLPRKPPKRSKREPDRPGQGAPPDEGGASRFGGAGYAAFGLLAGAVFLVPLGLPFGATGGEVLLVFGAALIGAFAPDVAAPEGPGALLRTLFWMLGLGRKADFLTASSRLGAGGARATHNTKAAALFAVGCAGLFALGPAGGSAWSAATLSYAAHLWRDSSSVRHEPAAAAVAAAVHGPRAAAPEGEGHGDPSGAEEGGSATDPRSARAPAAPGLWLRLAAKLPKPPGKKRRRRKGPGGPKARKGRRAAP